MPLAFKTPVSQYKLIFITAIFFTLLHNNIFFEKVLEVYNSNLLDFLFILSLLLVLCSLIVLIMTLFSSKYTTKAVLIVTLIISSLSSYFMNTYKIVIDSTMVQNIVQTNMNESLELFSIQQLFYLLFLGILPSFYIYKTEIKYSSTRKEFVKKIKTMLLSLIHIMGLIIVFSNYYASFFREHKPLRYYTNPTYWIYSIGNYFNKAYASPLSFKTIGDDAKIVATNTKKKLIILVVGEAARADKFSLNGYERITNPLLQKEDVITLSKMTSCGTSTAVSVPCMFSAYTKEEYTYKKGISTENVLDVLNKTNGVDILWRDNNSDSKGVADRLPYEDFKDSIVNTACQDECRDEEMLNGLDSYIQKSDDKNILIVLHQMGNHGPEYYKRYPKSFEKFTPVCKSNQLEQCSKEQINNAYDNAILYTDYFLSKTINFLKNYSKNYDTGMIYISDHGESLGENNIYLHGLPYFIAPQNQTHVASLLWFDKNSSLNTKYLETIKNNAFSQDNLFHSLLGLFDVQTSIYDKTKDIFNHAKN